MLSEIDPKVSTRFTGIHLNMIRSFENDASSILLPSHMKTKARSGEQFTVQFGASYKKLF